MDTKKRGFGGFEFFLCLTLLAFIVVGWSLNSLKHNFEESQRADDKIRSDLASISASLQNLQEAVCFHGGEKESSKKVEKHSLIDPFQRQVRCILFLLLTIHL